MQKNVRYAFPASASAAKTKPNKPAVDSLAMFSTRVIAFRASVRCEEGIISVMTPFAAGAEPEPKGRRKAATNAASGTYGSCYISG